MGERAFSVLQHPAQLESREKQQRKKRRRQQLGKIAPQIYNQQRIWIRRIAERAKECSGFRKHAPRKRKRAHSRKCLHQHNENTRYGVPPGNKTQRRSEHPRKRWVKNKSRLPESMVRPLRPPRKDDPFFPLPCRIQPRSRVKRDVVPRRAPQPEKRRHDQRRSEQRDAEGEEPCAAAPSHLQLFFAVFRESSHLGFIAL